MENPNIANGPTECPPGQRDNAGLNAKLQYDAAAALQNQLLADNQANARAWNSLNLRKAQNAETMDHWVDMLGVPAGQVGTTEGQQTVSPIRTATGDAIVGAVGVSADVVSAAVAKLSDAISGAVAEAFTAMIPVLVTAVGGASTPSQTQPKATT